MSYLVRYAVVDGEVVEDPEGELCRLDFVTHLVHNLEAIINYQRHEIDRLKKLAGETGESDDEEQ